MVRSLLHDAAGNIYSDTKGGVVYSLVPNNAGQLVTFRVAGVIRSVATYDGFRRLLARRLVNGNPNATHQIVLGVPPRAIGRLRGRQQPDTYLLLPAIRPATRSAAPAYGHMEQGTMAEAFHHVVSLDEQAGELGIWRVFATGQRHLMTSTKLAQYESNREGLTRLALRLGQNLLLDNPAARRYFGYEE